MHTQTTGQFVLAAAIVLAALMFCGTLLALNLRVTYPIDGSVPGLDGPTITRLLLHGCTSVPLGIGANANATVAISCPVWLHP